MDASTSGFFNDVHFPNGRIFTIGLQSSTVAAGCPPTVTRWTGGMENRLFADPHEHFINACAQVWSGIRTRCNTFACFFRVFGFLSFAGPALVFLFHRKVLVCSRIFPVAEFSTGTVI
jgi:hypothetical protein